MPDDSTADRASTIRPEQRRHPGSRVTAVKGQGTLETEQCKKVTSVTAAGGVTVPEHRSAPGDTRCKTGLIHSYSSAPAQAGNEAVALPALRAGYRRLSSKLVSGWRVTDRGKPKRQEP